MSEIQQQCRYMRHAAEEIDALWAALNGGSEQRREQWDWDRPRLIWYHIQHLVNSAAMVSKLLWGDETAETLHQRQALRGLLRVRATSPLRKRSVRNLSEHIDEDLIKEFTAPGVPHNVAQRNISQFGSIAVGGMRFYLNFDPATGILTTGGRAISLPAVAAEAARILQVIEEVEPAVLERWGAEERQAAARRMESPGGDAS